MMLEYGQIPGRVGVGTTLTHNEAESHAEGGIMHLAHTH